MQVSNIAYALLVKITTSNNALLNSYKIKLLLLMKN